MKQNYIDEKTGITYTLQGDYYLPDIVLPAEKENRPLGVWGQRHFLYLKQYRKVFYTNLLTSGPGTLGHKIFLYLFLLFQLYELLRPFHVGNTKHSSYHMECLTDPVCINQCSQSKVNIIHIRDFPTTGKQFFE